MENKRLKKVGVTAILRVRGGQEVKVTISSARLKVHAHGKNDLLLH